jgi:hypothetical protein
MYKMVCFLSIATLAFSCSKSPSPATKPVVSNGLMQLAVGNYWNYTKISFDSNSGAPIDTSADAINIVGEVMVDTTTYFQQTQTSITNINSSSFFYNADSNTIRKIDSAINYTFFKRVSIDSELVDSWPDTVTQSRCKGQNFLYGFTGTTSIDGYNCLRNIIYVNDCTGFNFQTWVYYLMPGVGLVRILHYKTKQNGNFYLDFQEDLLNYHNVH